MTDKNDISGIQQMVDELKCMPQYAQYVSQHKLCLIDSRLSVIDAMLDKGIVK